MAFDTIRPVGGGITLIVISAISIPLTIVFVALRLWVRISLRKKLELNDIGIIVGAFFAVANAVLTIIAVVYGGVGHQIADANHLLPALMRLTTALSLVCSTAHTTIKISIVHLYLVIFACSRRMVFASYTVITIICSYFVANLVTELLTCKPKGWRWGDGTGKKICAKQEPQYLSAAIFNMLIDIIIFTLPMTEIWRLQMDRKKKTGLILIFGLGFVICIISAIRIDAILKVDYGNITYSIVSLGVYSVIEPCLATINACLPLLQPLRTAFADWRYRGIAAPHTKNHVNPSQKLSGDRITGTARSGIQRTRTFFQINEDNISIGSDEAGHPTLLTTISSPGKVLPRGGNIV